MKLTFPLSSFLLAATLWSSSADAAVFSLHLKNIGHVRTDPILDQNCMSDHVHTFYGPKSLWPNTTYAQLRDVDPLEVSGNIVENNSLYWHPAVYRKVGNTYELQNPMLGVYYIWDPNDVRAFPPGFSMIAGGAGKIDPRAALSFECEANGRSYNEFPTEACPGAALFMEFKMPNCWNGQPRQSDDSHVTYTDGGGGNEPDDQCPPGYFKIPQIWLFIEFPDGSYQGGEYIFSDGSKIPHFDYMNGWNEQVLASALASCSGGDLEDFNPTGGTQCGEFTYKEQSVFEGEFDYFPPNPFPSNLISDEAVDGVLTPPRKSGPNPPGSCNPVDQPKEGGVSPGPSTPSPTPQPTAVPVSDPTPAPTPNPTAAPVPDPAPMPVQPTPVPEQSFEECEDACYDTVDACYDQVDVTCEDTPSEDDCYEVEDEACEDALFDCEHDCEFLL